LIGALRWNYLAKDHAPIKYLELFRVLHDGDGSQNSLLPSAWGKNIPTEIPTKDSPKNLTQEVLDFFEELFLTVVGRIVKPDASKTMKLKNQPLAMVRATSVVDENVSEALLT